jgi:hypothetical protein
MKNPKNYSAGTRKAVIVLYTYYIRGIDRYNLYFIKIFSEFVESGYPYFHTNGKMLCLSLMRDTQYEKITMKANM